MASFRQVAAVDTPRYWWYLDADPVAAETSKGSAAATLTPGASTAAPASASPLLPYGKSWTFDGTTDCAAASLSLSAQPIITLEFLLNWDAFSDNDDLAFEYTDNYNNANNNGFLIDPNASSAGGGKFAFGWSQWTGAVSNKWTDTFARPSAGARHHFALVMDRTNRVNKAYVDGVLQTLTTLTHTAAAATNWSNASLFAMCRNNASLFGAGKLDEIIIHAGELSQARVEAHFAALDNPHEVSAVGGIASAESFGVAELERLAHMQGIPSEEQVSTPELERMLRLAGVPSEEALGTAELERILQLAGIPSEEAVGEPTIDPGGAVATPSTAGGGGGPVFWGDQGRRAREARRRLVDPIGPVGIESAEAFGTPTVKHLAAEAEPAPARRRRRRPAPASRLVIAREPITLVGIESAEAVGQPTLVHAEVQEESVESVLVPFKPAPARPVAPVSLLPAQLRLVGIPSAEAVGAPTLLHGPPPYDEDEEALMLAALLAVAA